MDADLPPLPDLGNPLEFSYPQVNRYSTALFLSLTATEEPGSFRRNVALAPFAGSKCSCCTHSF